MSRLAEFRQLEQKLAAQLAELEAMKSSGELQKEIEFETKLRDLLSKYGYSLRDIINILDRSSGQSPFRSSCGYRESPTPCPASEAVQEPA